MTPICPRGRGKPNCNSLLPKPKPCECYNYNNKGRKGHKNSICWQIFCVSSKSDKRPQREKGFSLTADKNFHLQNKRLTNLSAPINDHDAVTKKFVADLLKNKAGTRYVNNELSKKANATALKDYALITDLGTLAIEFNDALKDKVDYNDLANTTKANKQYITVYVEDSWPSPVDGKIIRGSLCGNRQTTEVKASLVLNGNDRIDVNIIKPANVWSNHTIFSNPVSIKAGDTISL